MKKTFLIVGGIIIVLAFFYSQNQAKQTENPLGSVSYGSSYAWTATSSVGTMQIIENNPVVLGSVVISTDSAGTFIVKNATSTTDADAVTVASFEATQAEGTYTYDIYMSRGLQIVGGASADGLITVTYRQQ